MGASDRISFGAIGVLAWAAFRRRWWLILPVLAAHWWLSVSLEAHSADLFGRYVGAAWARTTLEVADDLLTAVVGAVVIGLALSGGRREALRPGRLLASLLVALPTALLAEVAASGPGWLRNRYLRLDEGDGSQMLIGALLMLVWLVHLLVLAALVGTSVPVAIDRRRLPLAAARNAFALTAGRRWRLLWMALALGVVNLATAAALFLPFLMTGHGDHWASNLGQYVLTGFNGVILAALYLDLNGLVGRASDRVAETFD